MLHDPLSASLFGSPEIHLGQALHQYLLRRGIPFHIVFPGNPLPDTVRTLVVFHVGAISKASWAWIESFADRLGCQVWLAGHSAETDEWFVPRNRSDLAALRTRSGLVFTKGFGEN